MAYTINWLVFQLEISPVIFFRFASAILHVANCYLVQKIMRPHSIAGHLCFLFLLLHPLAAFTVTWAFQFFSVLATSLILVAAWLVVRSQRQERAFLLPLVFFLSVTVKTIGAALAFLPLAARKLTVRRRLMAFAIIFIAGLYYSYSTYVGVQGFFREKVESQALIPGLGSQEPHLEDQRLLQSLNPELQFDAKTRAYAKLIMIGNNFSYYLQNSLFPLQIQMFRQPSLSAGVVTAIGLFIFLASVGFLSFAFVMRRTRLYLPATGLFVMIGGFLPVSGLFYIPHMKHSHTSPHYFYLSLIGLAWFVFSAADMLRGFRLRLGLFALTIIVGYSLIQGFLHYQRIQSRVDYLDWNLKKNPESKILKSLIEAETSK